MNVLCMCSMCGVCVIWFVLYVVCVICDVCVCVNIQQNRGALVHQIKGYRVAPTGTLLLGLHGNSRKFKILYLFPFSGYISFCISSIFPAVKAVLSGSLSQKRRHSEQQGRPATHSFMYKT